mgnify:CR=1 FL=1
MKKVNVKDIGLGVLALLSYFILSMIETLPFDIMNLDINSLPSFVKITYLLIYEILVIAIMLLIFNKKIVKDFNDIIEHHKEYFSKCINYYLIGLAVMLISNAFAIFVVNGSIAGNEEAIRELFKVSPLYIYLSSVIYAPIVEELVFRQGVRNVVGKNYLFVLVSGLLFGSLHVITSMNGIADLIYIIPYSSLGVAFAYMLYKYDNIFISMGFHFMHNGILIALQFLVLLFS